MKKNKYLDIEIKERKDKSLEINTTIIGEKKIILQIIVENNKQLYNEINKKLYILGKTKDFQSIINSNLKTKIKKIFPSIKVNTFKNNKDEQKSKELFEKLTLSKIKDIIINKLEKFFDEKEKKDQK